MRKYILCLIGCIFLLTSCIGETLAKKEEINNIYIEIINEEDKRIDKIEIKEKDVEKIKDIISNKKTYVDSGFVFAEGKYRIVLENVDGNINLYPYCGGMSTIRVGEKSDEYLALQEKKLKQLEDVVNKYVNIDKVGGIWEWSEYIGKE